MNDLKRYVLTKDNRIIDFKGWTTTRNGVDVPFNHVNRIVHIRGVGKTDATYEDYLHTIKAQSDNVFDLIEVGDLVKEYGNIYEISDINSDNRRTFVSQPADFKHQEWEISAIYKPNEKGDYIKVWEVKENETF